MKDTAIKQLAGALGLSIKSMSGKYVSMNCPFGFWRHPGGKSNPHAFGIEKGQGNHAFCQSCGWSSEADWMVDFLHARERMVPSGNKRDFKTAFSLFSDEPQKEPLLGFAGKSYEEELFEGPPALIEYPEGMREGMEPAYAEGMVHPYLESRNVSFETAEFLDLRFDPWRDRLVFPIRGYDQKLYGLHGRDISGNSDLKYYAYPMMVGGQPKTNSQVWLGEHWIDEGKPLLIAESVFDLAACLPLYRNVMTPRHTSINKELLNRLSGFDRIYTLFDDDPAGEKARQKIASLKGVTVTHLSTHPFNDAGVTPFDFLTEILAKIKTETSLIP